MKVYVPNSHPAIQKRKKRNKKDSGIVMPSLLILSLSHEQENFICHESMNKNILCHKNSFYYQPEVKKKD